MLQRLATLLITLMMTFTWLVSPCYAAPNNSSPTLDVQPTVPPSVIINRGNNNSVSFTNSFNSYKSEPTENLPNSSLDSFTSGVTNGLLSTAGVAVGVTAACYAIDGVVSAVLPPAAILAAGCPGAGAVAGGARAILRPH